jgi:hypothetical protein
MATWQIRCLLLLTSALAAIMLAASTTGALAQPSAPAAVAPPLRSITSVMPEPDPEIVVSRRSGHWHHGGIEPA